MPSPPSLPPARLTGALPADLQPALLEARDDLPVGYRDGCHLDFTDVTLPDCVYGSASSPTTVMLVGDSHAAQWLPTLERLAEERDWRLVATTKSSCPAVAISVWNRNLKREFRECDAWRRAVLDRARRERPALVFVASTNDYAIMDGTERRPVAEAMDAWRSGLADMLGRFGEVADDVVLLAETPRRDQDPVECLARYRDLEACGAPRASVVDETYARLETEAAARASAIVLTPTDWLCAADRCPLVMGDTLVYRDTDHLTARFARMLADRLGHELDRALAHAKPPPSPAPDGESP